MQRIDGAAPRVTNHRDLGVHSGVIGDGVGRLMQRGVVTNARKRIDTGVTVTGALFGSDALSDMADRNDAFRVEPISYTHAAATLARLDPFVSINGAIEVDILGQINGELAGDKYVGTIGGLVDFMRGSQSAQNGRSIVALPSRAGEDGPSTITGRLSGQAVTAARSDADFVVTEFGIAELRGQTVDMRARRLAAIAHPAFRDGLEREAARLPGG